MDFSSTKGKIITLSLVGVLALMGGGLAFGLNLREVQAQKVTFAEGCDKLRFAINEDFATYQKESIWPLSFLESYDSAYNPFYNPDDPLMSIKATSNKYRLLAVQNQKYQGAQQSLVNLDALKERLELVEMLIVKKESKERLNPNLSTIGMYLIAANQARYSPFGSPALPIFTLAQIEYVESEAKRMYFKQMSGAWAAEDQLQLDNAGSEFMDAWRNISDLCSKARA